MCPLRVHVRKSHIKQWWFDVHGATNVTPQKHLLQHISYKSENNQMLTHFSHVVAPWSHVSAMNSLRTP